MEDGIERALELTSTMQVLLDGVDTRLAEMERVVRPIHDVTDDLTRRYANLTETTALVEQYLAMFQVRNRCLEGRKKMGGGVGGGSNPVGSCRPRLCVRKGRNGLCGVVHSG